MIVTILVLLKSTLGTLWKPNHFRGRTSSGKQGSKRNVSLFKGLCGEAADRNGRKKKKQQQKQKQRNPGLLTKNSWVFIYKRKQGIILSGCILTWKNIHPYSSDAASALPFLESGSIFVQEALLWWGIFSSILSNRLWWKVSHKSL